MNTKCTVLKLLILFLHNTLRLVQWLKFIYVSSSCISFLIFLQLLELIPTAWQGNLPHPLQNGCWHILCHGTWEGSLAYSQGSLPLAHKLEKSSNALQWPTVISILLWWSPTEGVKMKKNQCMLSNINHTKLNCNKNSSKYM